MPTELDRGHASASSAARRGLIARILLGIHLIVGVSWMAARSIEYQYLLAMQGGFPGAEIMPQLEASDARQNILYYLQLATFVLAAIAAARWIHAANTTARLLGAEGLEDTPGWAVGWFFVPIAHAWRPFLAFRELWAASEAPYDWRGRSTPQLLSLWWGLWMGSSVLNAVAKRLAKGEELSDLLLVNRIHLGTLAMHVGAGMIFIALISRLAEIQLATAVDRPLEATLVPAVSEVPDVRGAAVG